MIRARRFVISLIVRDTECEKQKLYQIAPSHRSIELDIGIANKNANSRKSKKDNSLRLLYTSMLQRTPFTSFDQVQSGLSVKMITFLGRHFAISKSILLSVCDRFASIRIFVIRISYYTSIDRKLSIHSSGFSFLLIALSCNMCINAFDIRDMTYDRKRIATGLEINLPQVYTALSSLSYLSQERFKRGFLGYRNKSR